MIRPLSATSLAAVCVFSPTVAQAGAAQGSTEGALPSSSALPAASCTLVKELDEQGQPTFTLTLSGFPSNQKVMLKGPGGTRDVRVSSAGRYTADVADGTYTAQYRGKQTPKVNCTRLDKGDKPAAPADVTAISLKVYGAGSPQACSVPRVLNLAAGITASGPGEVTYAWNFSDGTVTKATVKFDQAGTQPVATEHVVDTPENKVFKGSVYVSIPGDVTRSATQSWEIPCN